MRRGGARLQFTQRGQFTRERRLDAGHVGHDSQRPPDGGPRIVAPETGVHLWTDNMQIPIGAPHAYTAEKFIDYVYEPEVQAPIEAYINYICPVNGTKEVLANTDAALAENPLIFPDAEVFGNTYIFRDLKPEEEQELNDAFQQLIGA